MTMLAEAMDQKLSTEVADLIATEAHLLDERRWNEWLELYSDDATFWAPSWSGEDTFTDDPTRQVSLIYTNKLGLQARIFRVEGRDSYATMPLPNIVHLVTNVLVEGSGDAPTAKANWLVRSFSRSNGAIMRGGRYEYRFRREGGTLRILEKKILVHDDCVVGAIDFYNI